MENSVSPPLKPSLTKKAVIITGAGSGIGAATTLEFSKQGYFIYLVGRRKEKLQEVAIHCRHGASVIGCDLLVPEQVTKKFAEILSVKIHRIEVLVNNAGTFRPHSALEGTDELWLEQISSNLLSVVRSTRAVLPYFLSQGSGSIVNIASTLALKPSAPTGAYSAAKAGLVSWTKSLALEFAGSGLRVNCVCPGLVDTPIHGMDQLSPAEKESKLSFMGTLQPLGRIGQASEIAKGIYFLAGADSPWTTGAILSIDGGINLL